MNRLYLVAAVSLITVAVPASAQSVRRRDRSLAARGLCAGCGDLDTARHQRRRGCPVQPRTGLPPRAGSSDQSRRGEGLVREIADQGHLDAQTTLGLLLFQGGDQAEGLKWLKKAALQGEPRALLMYGTALVNGDSVTQDPVLGYAYVSRAAAQGLEPAKGTLTQLDQILPLADRKRGLEIARTLAKAAPAPKPAPIGLLQSRPQIPKSLLSRSRPLLPSL